MFHQWKLGRLLEKFFPAESSAGEDNNWEFSCHNLKMTQNFFEHNPLNRLPHPLYSPDISPSNFYLFGKAKRSLVSWEIIDEINLLEELTEILNGISDSELQRIFRRGIEYIEKYWRRKGLFDLANILVFPVSFEINSFIAGLVLSWTPWTSQ
jgi:hypothetical protein